jgi:hypothetical protein
MITFPHYNSHGQAEFHHLSVCSTSVLGLGWAWASSRVARGLSTVGRLYRRQGLVKWWHLMCIMTGRGHMRPHMPGHRCSSAEIRSVTV